MFDLDEIFIYLQTHYPVCVWKKEKYNGRQEIAWRPTQRFEMSIHIGQFASSHLNGAEFISVGWQRRDSGTSVPCNTFEMFEKYVRKGIEDFNPKLLEETQLTLF